MNAAEILRRVLREEVEPIVERVFAAALERVVVLWLEPIYEQLEEVRDELARRGAAGEGGMATEDELNRLVALFESHPELVDQLPPQRRDYVKRRLLGEGRKPRRATLAAIVAEASIDLGGDDDADDGDEAA